MPKKSRNKDEESAFHMLAFRIGHTTALMLVYIHVQVNMNPESNKNNNKLLSAKYDFWHNNFSPKSACKIQSNFKT